MIKQEQKVIEYFIKNNNESKHFEEVAEDLQILIPNVRRILGQGTLKGTFKRVAIGCYEFAHYETKETKTEYIIHNEKDNQNYIKTFINNEDCKNWIINTLDLSKNWSFYTEPKTTFNNK